MAGVTGGLFANAVAVSSWENNINFFELGGPVIPMPRNQLLGYAAVIAFMLIVMYSLVAAIVAIRACYMARKASAGKAGDFNKDMDEENIRKLV
jgi:hypothetical protein